MQGEATVGWGGPAAEPSLRRTPLWGPGTVLGTTAEGPEEGPGLGGAHLPLWLGAVLLYSVAHSSSPGSLLETEAEGRVLGRWAGWQQAGTHVPQTSQLCHGLARPPLRPLDREPPVLSWTQHCWASEGGACPRLGAPGPPLSLPGRPLTCCGALVAHRGAGAASVHGGGLRGHGARAAASVIHVLVRLGVHQARGALKGSGGP